jgi:glycosyltransferase involved in cell wall biosynthesis
MNHQPLVSVIIPVFNCESYIDEALKSILNQTHTNLEILVCDDASTDETWKTLCSFKDSRIKLYRNEVNKGVVLTKNSLFEKAKGEYLLMQDGDDWSVPNRIERLITEFSTDPTLSACASNSYRVSNSGKIALFRNVPSKYIPLSESYELPFIPSSLMVKGEIIQQVGGFNPFFTGLLAEDHYWVILITEKYKLKYIDTPLYYYRFNENSITNTYDRKEKLAVTDLVSELINQRIATGSDWIQNKNNDAIHKYIDHKFSNSKWLAEKYRVMAAVQRDGKKRLLAIKLILKALKLNPLNLKNYITLKYILS